MKKEGRESRNFRPKVGAVIAGAPHPVALITGGTSGIGQHCARRLAGAGWRAIAASRRAGIGAEEFTLPDAPGVYPLTMDVDDPASTQRAVAAAEIAAGPAGLAAVVCAAGWGSAGAFEEYDDAEMKALFETNFFGVARTLRAALPAMRGRGAGRLIVVGSVAGRIGMPHQSVYAATKHALEGLVESVAMELAATGVKLTLVQPGDYRTGFTGARRMVAGATVDSPYAAHRERALREAVRRELAAPEPEAVARLVERLLAARNPPVRRAIGPGAEGILLRRLLPERLFLWALARVFNKE